jgi:8-oxo-dGTP pyrophosphatase MutT (NUDIX family)
MTVLLADDNLAFKYPVSVKGVILFDDGDIPLLLNLRNEYELPGGKLEPEEQPETCLIREIQEELNQTVKVVDILDSWLYTITQDIKVLIVTYFCKPISKKQEIKISQEHKSLLLTKINNIEPLNMPNGYKNSIRKVQEGRYAREYTCGGED